MTSTTLTRTLSTRLDANGAGLIILRPDVGQNWAPLFVRVSTQSQQVPLAHCTVYHGSPGVPVQQSQYIDDTFLGNGDTSSIISGTPILYGEAIMFSFKLGTPGDTAIATVYGQTSDLPPNLDLIPQVPGARFTGHPTTEITQTLAQATNQSFGPGVVTTLPGDVDPTLEAFDVRQFSSYYLEIAATTVGVATRFNSIEVIPFWLVNPDDINTADFAYEDSYTFWANNLTGGPFFAGGPLLIQDSMHGAYMGVQIGNNSSTDTVKISWKIVATTRVLPSGYAKQSNAPEGTLINIDGSIPAGGNMVIPCFFGYGDSWFQIAAGANPIGSTFAWAGDFPAGTTPTRQFFGHNVAAGAVESQRFIFPKRSAIITLNGAVGTAFNFTGITLYNKN